MIIEIPDNQIKQLTKDLENITDDAVQRALTKISKQVGVVLDRYTPKNTGRLRDNKKVIVTRSGNNIDLKVNYYQPYAGYQYYNRGNRFKNYTTPGTGDKWLEKAHREVIQLIQEELVRQLQ